MKVYKTTPINITDLLTFQKSKTEEGYLLTDFDYNFFISDYTSRIEESLDGIKEVTKNLSSVIDQLKDLISKIQPLASTPIPGQTGLPAGLDPNFAASANAIVSNLDTIKQGIADTDTQIDGIKEKL